MYDNINYNWRSLDCPNEVQRNIMARGFHQPYPSIIAADLQTCGKDSLVS